jgi:PAS domain S-box-containing protein
MLVELKERSGRMVTQRSFAGQTGTTHYRVQHFPVFDAGNTLVGVGGVYYDITAQVDAVDRWRATRDSFNDIVRSSSDWVWETGDGGNLTFISDRITEIAGRPPALLLGRPLSGLRADESDAAAEDSLERALALRASFRNKVLGIRDSHGRVRRHFVSGVPFFHLKTGRFAGFRGAGTDISGQHEAEQQAQESRQQLEAALAELNAKNLHLALALDRAQVATRAKDEFLANMSHELRTPLNAILGFAEIIKDQLFGAGAIAKYAEYARDIHASGRHLLDLISDILDLSKIESGRFELRDDVVDLPAIVAACWRLVAQKAAEAGIVFTTDLPADLPGLRADEVRMRQIMLNLLSNAVKFTPGPGQVTAGGRRADDGSVALWVSDTGIGMTQDEITVALQPFRQVDSKIARRHEGTGLGLPLVKALSELHGGRLVVESTPGKGTTMRVVLPADRVLAAHTGIVLPPE